MLISMMMMIIKYCLLDKIPDYNHIERLFTTASLVVTKRCNRLYR